MFSQANLNRRSASADWTELDQHQLSAVNGGKQVIVDGMTMEMSDGALSAMIRSGAAASVTIRGVRLHGSEL